MLIVVGVVGENSLPDTVTLLSNSSYQGPGENIGDGQFGDPGPRGNRNIWNFSKASNDDKVGSGELVADIPVDGGGEETSTRSTSSGTRSTACEERSVSWN